MGENFQYRGWGGNPAAYIYTEKKKDQFTEKIFSHFLTKIKYNFQFRR